MFKAARQGFTLIELLIVIAVKILIVGLSLPAWCASFYLPLSLLGLWSWESRSALILKLTAMYVLFFAVVGKAANFYWGWLCIPPLALGVVRAPESLRELLLVILGRHDERRES